MEKNRYQIDPQLLADSHELLVWRACHIRLHHNATLPWIILIPETTELELHDLSTGEQLNILQLSRLIGEHFRQNHGMEKINFAAIGNVVQQLHIHVIGRHHKDPLWPDVVWGRDLPAQSYQTADIQQLKSQLHTLLESQQR